MKEFTKVKKFMIGKSEVELEDGIIDSFFGVQQNLEFAELHSMNYDLAPPLYDADVWSNWENYRVYSQFEFQQSTVVNTYGRARYNFFDFLGDVGGVLDILMYFGFLLTGMFVERVYLANLIQSFYISNGNKQENQNSGVGGQGLKKVDDVEN